MLISKRYCIANKLFSLVGQSWSVQFSANKDSIYKSEIHLRFPTLGTLPNSTKKCWIKQISFDLKYILFSKNFGLGKVTKEECYEESEIWFLTRI